MNMLRNLAIFVGTICFVSLFQAHEAAQCKEVEFTADKCRSENYIEIASQKVQKGANDVRIALTGFQTEATWFCGTTKESVKWGKDANQIRVNYLSDGTVQWTVYNCDDLSGPVKAGEECSDEAFSTACPGDIGSNVTCVFEVSTSTSFIDQTKTAVQVTGSVSRDVKGLATAEISGSITRERSEIKEVKYQQKSYLVIPAGFKFCSHSDARSVKDVLAPTGFKWQCSTTKFVQTKLSYKGGCTDLPKCTKRLCVSKPTNGGKLALAMWPLVIAYVTAILIF